MGGPGRTDLSKSATNPGQLVVIATEYPIGAPFRIVIVTLESPAAATICVAELALMSMEYGVKPCACLKMMRILVSPSQPSDGF